MQQKNIYINSLKAVVVVLTVLYTGIIGFSEPSMAQYQQVISNDQDNSRPSFLMRTSMGSALSAGKIGGKRFADRKAMEVFYSTRDNKPYWLGDRGPRDRAETLLEVLETSWTHGLNPFNYHIEDIRKHIEKPKMLKKAELELLLSDAFLRYAQDLNRMRINPKDMKLEADHWRAPAQSHELYSLLSSQSNFDRVLKAIEPQGKTYKKLRQELIRLSEEDSYHYERFLPVEFGGLMKPGWGHRGVINLRRRMGLEQPQRNKGTYDDTLAAAVMKFQRANDLEPDGIIGDKTLQLLNRTKEDKMLQIIANLERLRWVEEEKPDRFIVVNIPSAMMWALDRGKVKLEMPVIVGSPWRRTRVFKTTVTGVRLNPTWTIPATVKRFDILPKIQEDENYLLDKGIELYHGYGRNAVTLDPTSFDWQNIGNKELHGIRMVMTPGEHNPLGRVRILMPNPYNMYLHDTNHPELFDKPERQLSSGCIRLKYPEKVAQFVMEGQSGFNSRFMDEVFATNKKTDFDSIDRMPVYVLYYTAWLGNKGKVVYGTDVYKYDKKLIGLLKNIDGFYIPRKNSVNVAGRSAHPELASVH